MYRVTINENERPPLTPDQELARELLEQQQAQFRQEEESWLDDPDD